MSITGKNQPHDNQNTHSTDKVSGLRSNARPLGLTVVVAFHDESHAQEEDVLATEGYSQRAHVGGQVSSSATENLCVV
jgi:hypothetical protein